METIDEVIRDKSFEFIDKARAAGKPFFISEPVADARCHASFGKVRQDANARKRLGHLPEAEWPKFTTSSVQQRRNSEDTGVENNTILVFTTDNGAEDLSLASWAGRGHLQWEREPCLKAASVCLALSGGLGRVPANKVENALMLNFVPFPTLVAAAGNPNIVDELKKGKQLGDQNFKVHLDGYNQLDFISGKGPSQRKEIIYFAESTLG